VSAAHVGRLWSRFEVKIAGHEVGIGASVALFLIAGAISLWLWRLAVGLDRSIAPPGA
jgi:hypothetical protein